ncbi:MAG TPA: DUF6795 domain-containing protein [Rhodanobacteraceae bacterium]|nr:DUF6795 domain-containing protein [Rhodanobacteraceae bacterium]
MSVGLLSVISEGCAMGAPKSWVLFSEAHGTVLMHGKPVAGAEVVETARISGDDAKNRVQRFVTGPDGKFHFPAMVKQLGLLWRMLPGQPVVNQSIVITFEGVDYAGWKHGKLTFTENTELDGQPLDFLCELTDKPGAVGTHYGICKLVGGGAGAKP